jgi:chemotaxis protein methyltransferase CheR
MVPTPELILRMAEPAGHAGRDATLFAALARLVGLAPSEVLRRRLARVGPLIAQLDLQCPSVEAPAWATLLDAVTVQETKLFRDAAQLLRFRDSCLPDLIIRAGRRPLSILAAGCATGEEAWSLGLLAWDAAARLGAPPPMVLGMDLCRQALAKAAAGRYHAGPPDALREVPADYRPLFRHDGAEILVPDALRPRVRFARRNLLDLPEDGAWHDVVYCRNVLIYLTPEGRLRVLAGLVARLRPGGILLLSATDVPPPTLGLRRWNGDTSIWRRDAS